MKKQISFILIMSLLLLTFGSCRKYLEVNQNPNIAQNATPELLLPSAQVQIASALGVDLQINGSIWAQHWTQSTNASQYRYLEQYLPVASNYDRVWGLLYNGALADLRQLDRTAAQQNRRQYIAISKLLQAYTFQLLTDGFGDIPFTEALRGGQDGGGITSPKFDPQAVVYDGIIALIDSGLTIIDESDPVHPGNDDIIYQGDMHLWRKFGNTLKLRVHLRLSEVNPGKAQAGIAQLEGAEFIEEGESAQVNFISTPGNQNPLYSEISGLNFTQNLVASATSTDTMKANDDWRRFIFYTLVGGDVVGLRQGNFTATSAGSLSAPSAAVGAQAANEESATAPVKLLSSYESYFLQAEAVARNWLTGDDRALFERGIYASFREYEGIIESFEYVLRDSLNGEEDIFIMSTDYAAYRYINGDTITGTVFGDTVIQSPSFYWGQYPEGGSLEQKLEHIITQKWFSMNGNQGFEAWTEWRRTGFPRFFQVSANSQIGSTMPVRFLYPNTEATRNLNFPGQTSITTKVWWDTQ